MSHKPKDAQAQPEIGSRAVRERVVRHLRGLLVPGAIGLSACKSSTPPVVCDPMPEPTSTGPAPTNTAPDATANPPVVCDPMPPPTSEYAKPPPGRGNDQPPVVCDPMPPPAPMPKK